MSTHKRLRSDKPKVVLLLALAATTFSLVVMATSIKAEAASGVGPYVTRGEASRVHPGINPTRVHRALHQHPVIAMAQRETARGTSIT